MDNLTHSLTGWALGQAGLKTTTRKGLAALILAANMPDIDVFFGWAPWEPLAMHRGFTHSLAGGVVAMPPLLFGLLMLLDRWQMHRGKSFESALPMRPFWLLALCYLGALTHPLLDLMTTYSVQLLSPFSGKWFHADGLFIIDLWLWLLLGGTIAWSKWREKHRLEWRRPVQAALAVMLGYIGINVAVSQRADAAVHDWAGERPAEAIFASPPPVTFWQRRMAWRERDCYRFSRFDPVAGGLGKVSGCYATDMSRPVVQDAIRRDPELRDFLRWSILPIASVRRTRCAVRVTIGDARYGEGRQSRLSHTSILPTGAPGC